MTEAETNPSTVLVDDVHIALRLWRKPQDAGSPLRALLLFQQARAVPYTSDRLATKTVLLRALQTLEQTHSLEATILRQRYLKGQSAHSVANRVNLSEATLFRRENEGLVLLTAIIQRQENAARAGHLSALTARLEPSTYSRLIGVDTHLERLSAALTAPGPPWLLALEGTGGIGKTSLADALMRHWVHTNLDAEIGWVSAPTQVFSVRGGIRLVEKPALTADALVDALVGQLLTDLPDPELRPPSERLAALRTRLKRKAHVIVIDNLETVIDVSSLLPILRRLANPTRFILTSRQSLFEEADIFHYPIPELDESNTLAFVRWEAAMRDVPALRQAADRDLQPIYEIVGGNPLALRLVVGLTHNHALGMVLADLATARGASSENLYQFIYRRAWDQLDDVTRQAFLVMPLVSSRGGTIDFLAEVTSLSQSKVRRAVEHLVALNLVDSRDDLHTRRYTIHNLTRTFLQETVAHWLGPDILLSQSNISVYWEPMRVRPPEVRTLALPSPATHPQATEDTPKVEAYALARLQGPAKSLRLLVPYTLLAGVSSEALEGFATASIELSIEVIVGIDIFVYAKRMEIDPYWKQTVRYSHGHEFDLASFVLTPISSGSDLITVEFYYERHWLTKIEIEVEIIEQTAVSPIG